MKIIIQAREGSTRLPGKIFKLLNDKSLLENVIFNCEKITREIIVAIPENNNEVLKKWLQKRKIVFFEGSEIDVLSRFQGAAKKFDIDSIMRVTSDCPFVDPAMMNYCSALFLAAKLDFITNAFTAVDGQEVEIFSKKALDWCCENAKSPHDREHVTTYIKNDLNTFNKSDFSYAIVQAPYKKEWLPKMSIDTQKDLDWAREHIASLNKETERYDF